MLLKRIQLLWLPAAATAVFAAGVHSSPSPVQAQKRVVNFNRDVRPILSEHCYRCHGPSAKDAKAGLRLDNEESAKGERNGKAAIVPGNSGASKVFARISAQSDDDVMPPSDSGMARLSAEQIETLKLWIDQGAKYEKHWALIPPKLVEVPKVGAQSWGQNPIDGFVFSKLAEKGLKPEPEADKSTLLRRASLTLTGLPPTPSESDAFLKDKSKNAYEKAVDRLLSSPRYGEHQARFWLDAVRYGDTHGLHLDNERQIYPYRDWVVRAFNEDLPYDKFALWQLAGDLLPNPKMDQLIATGYVRMNPTTNEGGAIAEEFQAKNTFDRVDTTSTVFLGMTVACARCHSHKYDPVTQKDYYRLFAFFNSTADEPLDGNLLLPGPSIKAPNPDESTQLKKYESELRSIESRVNLGQAAAWLSAQKVQFPEVSKWERSAEFTSADFDQAFETDEKPATWTPITLELEKASNFIEKANTSVYLHALVQSAFSQEIGLRLSSDDAVKLWVNGELVHQNKVLRGVLQSVDNVRIHLNQGSNEIMIKVVNATGPGGVFVGLGDDRDKEIETVTKLQGKPEGEQKLRTLYLLRGEGKAAEEYRKVYKTYTDYSASIPETLIAKELPEPRPAFVLRRGEYNLPEEKVERAVPAALGSIPKGAPMNRLGFAQWLTAPDNPLFARVFVNRVWQQHFGTGIVKTAEDFGNQGEWPSHPELLDFLSVWFRKENYSLKKLHRLIVTSEAFKQRSSVDKQKFQIDPENRLISRGPRFRLDAEVLRDQALYASGLLVEKRGGHGFKPYQPAGLWEEVAFQESTTAKYAQDMTADVYRRSLYLFWKRTSPHPVMLTFDAPMREMCVVRRARTNTPLQALVTMNEPAFMEAARHFAQRVMGATPVDPQRIQLAFELALGRTPTDKESMTLLKSLATYRTKFGADLESAKSVVSIGMSPPDSNPKTDELAAWTLVCSTIFNLDEFLTQH